MTPTVDRSGRLDPAASAGPVPSGGGVEQASAAAGGLWFETRGSGPPLALIPGGPGLASDYLGPLADLLTSSFTVVLVDSRGCGRSRPRNSYEIADHVADLEAVRLALNLERWTVVGHSFGGALALAYALEHPDRTDGVIVIANGAGITDDRSWHAAYDAARDAGRDPKPVSAFPHDPEVHSATLASWRRWTKERDVLRRVADMAAPFLSIVGSEDVRPAWPAEQLAWLAPQGHFEVIDGAGHLPWEDHPDRVHALIADDNRAAWRSA
jgi:proline iminopeptidase